MKNLKNGTKAVGLFNRGKGAASISLKWTDAGLSGKQALRDLWTKKDLGEFNGTFSSTVPSHGVILLRCAPR